MAFKDNLIRIRQLRGKKPPEVILGTGIAKGQYYAWEKGEYEPSAENLDILSSYFQVPREIFFKESIADSDVLGKQEDSHLEWFKRTIETLIQVKGEYINVHREVWDELKEDKNKINNAREGFQEQLKEVWNLIKLFIPEKIKTTETDFTERAAVVETKQDRMLSEYRDEIERLRAKLAKVEQPR